MMKFLIPIALLVLPVICWAQEDTVIVTNKTGTLEPVQVTVDTLQKTTRKFSPKQAAIRSAILPGLGQIYNKKYWKVPIVYVAIGIPVYQFFDNKTWYNRTRYALAVAASTTNPLPPDSLAKVHEALLPLIKQPQRLISYRNSFRKNMDYSILFTLLFWGLNVVDATVDAHLKGFTVSEDLSMQLKPTAVPGGAGLSLVFTFNERSKKGFSF